MVKILFAVINFGILLFILSYLYHRVLVAKINSARSLQDHDLHLLKTELICLQNQIKESALDFALQAHQVSILLAKVQQWHANYLAIEHEMALQVKQLQVQIDTKNQLKLVNLAAESERNDLLIAAISQLNVLLKAHFKQPENATDFLEKVCSQLGKGY